MWIGVILLEVLAILVPSIGGCREGNKNVGVCLHVYLERDFLSLENIVYPNSKYDRFGRSVSNLKKRQQQNPGFNFLYSNSNDSKSSEPASYAVDPYRDRDWIEGPELEDHCKKLKQVIECFEEVLVDCDKAYDFFRYRHLLYALSEAHRFVCMTAHLRKERFLRFLKTIDCAERARKRETSCHRHNVSSVVWNQILRLEVGEEICHSLNTQRACLLEHKYIYKHCGDLDRVTVYSDLSSYFLSIWCKLPIHPKVLMNHQQMMPSSASSLHLLSWFITVLVTIMARVIIF